MGIRFTIVAGTVLLFTGPVFAHHPSATSGAGGADPRNTISATTLDQGQSALSSVYEFIHFGGLSDAALGGSGMLTQRPKQAASNAAVGRLDQPQERPC
jgi:hypothetical protein